MLIMPLTYYPILRTAADKNVMEKHVNGGFGTWIGFLFLVITLAAIPLMVVTEFRSISLTVSHFSLFLLNTIWLSRV